MSPASIPTQPDALLAIGLKNLWFPICRSDQIADQPLSMRRLGHKLALWRDTQGALHALEDHCPHRGAPLSRGVALGDRIACPYHGVQVRHDGTVMTVPGSPGCRMEGLNCVRSLHVQERCWRKTAR